MTSFEENYSNAVEVDGIRYETLMSQRVLRIPRSEPGAKTKIQFCIQITNNTKTSRLFLLFFARPAFFQGNKQKLPRFGSNVNGSYNPEISDFKLLAPHESVSLLLEGYFCWEDSKLKFVFCEKVGQYWIFCDFRHGEYWLQLTYENQYSAWEQRDNRNDSIDLKPVWENQIYNNPRSNIVKMENFWVGEVHTCPIKFQLIKN